jgi:hypothetical protein
MSLPSLRAFWLENLAKCQSCEWLLAHSFMVVRLVELQQFPAFSDLRLSA